MNLLRFTTAGSVDDGKSTLTGRLLYDTGQIKADVLKTLTETDESEQINLAYVTDGLRAERQQGITIDVAYKYFTTTRRKFISVDAPGHFQFTRNMVTGASGVDAIIILIDARNGITDQTRIHSRVASFMRIKNVVVAVNKMDMTGYLRPVFERIRNEFLAMSGSLSPEQLCFIPVSALKGDNISTRSGHMPWYEGETLLHFLETCETTDDNSRHAQPLRFAVQYIQPGLAGYYGKVLSGRIKTGDPVIIYPAARESRVLEIITGYRKAEEAVAGQNIHLTLEDAPDLQRGALISGINARPEFSHSLRTNICWLDAGRDLVAGKKYLFRMYSMEVTGCISGISRKILEEGQETGRDHQTLSVNQFAEARIETGARIACDPFSSLRETGRGIIIDPETNDTSGAFTIV